jgi:hypothetical protein
MRTAIQEAFAKINNLPPAIREDLRRADQRASRKRDVDYKLTFKTYNKLKSEGIVS